MSINALTADVREQVDAFLKQQLARHSINETLRRAMEHGVLLGGKRVRPYLLMTIAEICRGDKQAALTAAGAIEFTDSRRSAGHGQRGPQARPTHLPHCI